MESQAKKYILFCSQEANFQTRSMLIPYDLILTCEERKRDLDILRQNATKTLTNKENKCMVDYILVQNIIWDGNIGKYEKMPFTDIIHEFTQYADGFDGIYKSYDEIWVKEIIIDVASSGFNHIANYCNFRTSTHYNNNPVDIVEGFLALESNNGKIEKAQFDTVNDMLIQYFSVKD